MGEILKINNLPSPSWSWLKINDAELEFDVPLKVTEPSEITEIKNESEVQIVKEIPNQVRDDDFATRDDSSTENAILNSFQNLPELLSGTGNASDSIFEGEASLGIVIPANKKLKKPVVLNYDLKNGENALTNQIVIAEENSESTLILVCSSDENAGGFQALRTKVFAKSGAKIKVVKVQLLGKKFIQIDDTASYSAENAFIELTHVELGGEKVYVGAGCNLGEYKASFKSDLGYFLKDEQLLDLNFIVNHIGKKTLCRMKAAGSLKDKAQKTYRGTIDFKTGSCGSDGDEQEEVLLLSPNVLNNSMPVILCTEEDISGEHGASIGRLSDEMLFYMETRGINKAKAENIISRAKVQAVVSTIEDEKTVEKINSRMNLIFGED